mgnify:CR=1 FL=1
MLIKDSEKIVERRSVLRECSARSRQDRGMRILLVEDDPAVAAGVIDGLGVGFSITHVQTGQGALESFWRDEPDLILLDLGLPDMDGTDVCRSIRTHSSTPIIVLSARGDEIDRVLTLEMGADDFMVKPFGMRELIARIRAVGRRSAPGGTAPAEGAAPNERIIHGLTIDMRTQRCLLNGEEIHLTPKEFELVVYLSEDPGAVYRRQDILHDVWDTNWYGTTKTLDAHVAAIRKKLGSAGWIESVRGVGFRFGGPA